MDIGARAIRPEVTTDEIDRLVHEVGSVCLSIGDNDSAISVSMPQEIASFSNLQHKHCLQFLKDFVEKINFEPSPLYSGDRQTDRHTEHTCR